MGQGQFGIDPDAVAGLAGEIAAAKEQGHELCLVVGGGNIFRGMAGGGQGLRPRHRRLHGHAGDGDERAGAAERAREARRRHPRPVGDPDGERVRALHPPPRPAAPGEGPDRHVRRRHRQSLSSRPTPPPRCAPPKWAATPCSRAPASTASTPPTRRRSRTPKRYDTVSFSKVLSDDLKVMDAAAVALVPRQQYSDRRLQHPPAGQPRRGAGRARDRDDRPEWGVEHDDHRQHRRSQAPHARRGRGAEARPWRPAHRPRLDRLARSGQGRGLRRATCRSTRSRRSRRPKPRMLSVQVWDRSNVGPVEKAIRIGRARPQPDHRRPDDPPADPRADRGAPQGARQARRPICREGAHRGPQRPPRRHGPSQARREEARDQRGRAQAPRASKCRS